MGWSRLVNITESRNVLDFSSSSGFNPDQPPLMHQRHMAGDSLDFTDLMAR